MNDYYSILDVKQDAGAEEIKRAYRTLARKFHPDVATSGEAEETFKKINEAYNVLSNPLKRADYDLKRRPKGAPEADPGQFRRLVAEAIWRVFLYALIGGAAGAAIESALVWLAQTEPIGFFNILGGMLAGIFTGLVWGIDQNFVVETFLGEGSLGRTFTFLRTVIFASALAYFLGRIVGFGELAIGAENAGMPTIIASAIGVVIGAVLGSDGEAVRKLFSGMGRFELFYTLLRGLMIAAIAAAVAGVFTLMALRFGVELINWPALIWVGFSLGMIIGSMRPPNLAAYASYASASVRTTLFALIVLGSLLIGITLGIIGRDFFSPYL